jgi:indolepyruvate ferredoxin oxidoreductase
LLRRGLASIAGLRGTPLDVFGYALERRMERELAADYAATIDAVLPKMTRETLSKVEQLADLPDGSAASGM